MNPPDALLRQLRASAATLRRVSEGYSGAGVWSVQSDSGKLALKAWTPRFDLSQVQRFHRLQSMTALMPRLVPLASGRTFQCFDGVVWEAAHWQNGRHADIDAPVAIQRAGVEAIADIHAAWSRSDVPKVAPERSETLSARRAAAERTFQWLRHGFVDGTSFGDPVLNQASTWISRYGLLGCERVGRVVKRLAPVVRPTQFVLRDIHRDHVLFDDGTVTSVLDMDAVAFDHPIVDIARWWGSFTVRGPDDLQGRLMKDDVETDGLVSLTSELADALAAYRRRWTLHLGTDPEAFAGPIFDSFGETSDVRTWATIASEIMQSTAWLSLVRWFRWETGPGNPMRHLDRPRRHARLRHWLTQSEAFAPR